MGTPQPFVFFKTWSHVAEALSEITRLDFTYHNANLVFVITNDITSF